MPSVQRGALVRLTNPNYPDIDFVGTFERGAIAGEPTFGQYSTFTVILSDGERVRSEGVLEPYVAPVLVLPWISKLRVCA